MHRVEDELQRGLVFQHGSTHSGHVEEVLPLRRELVDLGREGREGRAGQTCICSSCLLLQPSYGAELKIISSLIIQHMYCILFAAYIKIGNFDLVSQPVKIVQIE